MSIKFLPRELGVIISCNGNDDEECTERLQTANILAGANRGRAKKLGWGRGLRKGKKRHDLCPKHLADEKAAAAKNKAAAAARRAKRDKARKAKAAT